MCNNWWRCGHVKIYSRDVDRLFRIGLSWILGGVCIHGDATGGGFEADFGFAPYCNAHTNLTATFSEKKKCSLEPRKYGVCFEAWDTNTYLLG